LNVAAAGAAAILPHWLNHYVDMGFRREHMLLKIHTWKQGEPVEEMRMKAAVPSFQSGSRTAGNYNVTGFVYSAAGPENELADVMKVLYDFGINYTLWVRNFS